jgi:hypothetical protein
VLLQAKRPLFHVFIIFDPETAADNNCHLLFIKHKQWQTTTLKIPIISIWELNEHDLSLIMGEYDIQ